MNVIPFIILNLVKFLNFIEQLLEHQYSHSHNLY